MSPNLDPERLRQAFDRNPDDAGAFESLQERYFLAGDWQALVGLIRSRLEAPTLAQASAARAALLFRLGQVLEDRCLDADAAMECYWEAVRLDRAQRGALRQLRRIQAARAQWDQVLQIAEIEDATPMKPFERGAFLAEMGRVWLEPLDEPEQARVHFERALEQAPEQPDAIAGLAQALETLGRHREAAAAWERLVEQERGPDRAVALVALADLCAEALDDPERAIELYRRALTDDPRQPKAIDALVADARARAQWPLLADLLERQLAVAPDDGARAAIAMEASQLELEHLGNPHAARMWLSRAQDLDPTSAVIPLARADLEARVGNADEQLVALDAAIELAGESVPTSALVEAGTLHAERGAHERALPLLRAALDRAPDHPVVCEALSDTLARLGRHEELAELLERRAALAADDPETQAEAFADLGRLHENELDDLAGAVQALGRAFELCPTLPGVAAGLERLHRKAEQWSELRSVLERARHEGPPNDRRAFHCSLGEVLLDHFDDADGATRAFESALELDPTDARGLRGLARVASASGDPDAVLRANEREAAVTTDPVRLGALARDVTAHYEGRAQLEQALGWAERWVGACPSERIAVETAVRLQEQLGRDDDLVTTLERLDDLVPPADQAPVRRRLAELHVAAGRIEAALTWLDAALEREPADLDTHRARVAQLERAVESEPDRLDALARAYRGLADVAPGPERCAVLERLEELLAERLGDLDAAIVVGWRLANDPEASEEAVARLEERLERAGRYEELVQFLTEQRRRQTDGPEACDLDLRLGWMLLHQLSRFEDAASAFRRARTLARDEQAESAVRGLERALRGGNDFAELAELLGERAASLSDPVERAGVALERATLLEEAMGDEQAAREAYEELCSDAQAPEVARAAGERLERLLERGGDWVGLRTLLEQRAGSGALDLEVEIEVRERIAGLCRDHLGDPGGCIEQLEAVGRLAPERVQVWRGLALLHQQHERWGDLARVLEAELSTGPDHERELVLRARAAELCATRLDDEPRAREHFERILELDPGHEGAAEFCLACAERDEQWREVARLLELRLDAALTEGQPSGDDPGNTGRPSARIALRLRLAATHADALGDPDAAVGVLAPALDELGPQPVVAEPLADLYERCERVDELVELCHRASNQAVDPGERASWNRRRAHALAGRGDRREAADAWRRVLADCPEDREAGASLCALYRDLGEHALLAERLEADLVRVAPAPDAEIPVRQELAALLAGPLERPDEAGPHLDRALELDPTSADTFQQALALAERMGRPEEQERLIAARLAQSLAAEDRTRLLERRAALLAEQLGRPEEAAAAYREALALTPGRAEARAGLRATLEGLGRWPAVLDCLYVEAAAAAGSERTSILEQAAHIALVHLGSDAALPWLERLRAEHPDDGSIISRIADVHRQAGRPEALLRALEDEITCTRNPARRRDLHAERARVLERDLAAPARAAAALEAARTDAPDDPIVLAELDRLYALLGRARERVGVVEARIPAADVALRVELHRTAGELWQDTLAEPARAVPHWLHALDLDGADDLDRRLDVLGRLGRALRGSARTDAWVRAGEEELRIRTSRQDETDRARVRDLHRELAHAYRHDLNDRPASLQHLRALVDDPDAVDDEAETLLIGELRAHRDPLELAGRLGARLQRRRESAGGEIDATRDAGLWLELALLREEVLHELPGASRAYREVLLRDEGSLEAVRGLRRTAERLGDWAQVADALDLELDRTARDDAHASTRGALLRRLGEVCRDRLGERTRASDAYAAALELDGGDVVSLHALQGLLEGEQAWPEAAARYEQEIGILGDRDASRRQEVWLRVGEIARDRLDDPARAAEAFACAEVCGALSAGRLQEWSELLRETGDSERELEVTARWCDHPSGPARARDHVDLADRLDDLGRKQDALARAHRATEVDPDEIAAWDAVARLCQETRDPDGAARAWERAAQLGHGREAAERFVRAALLVEDPEPERAADLLARAVERDPTSGPAQAHRARLEAGLGRSAAAEEAAGLALDGADELPGELRLETALVGGRAARDRDRTEQAAAFFARALDEDAGCREALEQQAEVLFALGELEAARPLLEKRLGMQPPPDAQAEHLAMLGAALEQAGDPQAALVRFEHALELEPELGDAHAGRVRVHEAEGAREQAIDALRAWADCSSGAERSDHLLRAAKLHRDAALVSDSPVRAGLGEDLLRGAVEADPGCGEAQALLAAMLWDEERREEALEATERGLEAVDDERWRSPLAMVRARALESAGEATAAIEAYAEAARCDRTGLEAALAESRLLRAAGEWSEAAEALAGFAERHPDPASPEMARVYQQLGRLWAGPLENLDRAADWYERALAAQPNLEEVKQALAGVLAHRPERRVDARQQHVSLLAEDPTRAASLRALVQMARERSTATDDESPGRDPGGDGLVILCALGAASPSERDEAPDRLRLRLAQPAELSNRTWQALREAAAEAGSALRTQLGAGMESDLDDVLAQSDARDLSRAMCTLAAVALELEPDPGADLEAAAARERLASDLGRWSRRKVRRALGGLGMDDVAGVDFEAWRLALRVRSAGRDLDRDGDLARVLAELVAKRDEGPESGDMDGRQDRIARIRACPEARTLLGRVVETWVTDIQET